MELICFSEQCVERVDADGVVEFADEVHVRSSRVEGAESDVARSRTREEVEGLVKIHVVRALDAVYAEEVGAAIRTEHVCA